MGFGFKQPLIACSPIYSLIDRQITPISAKGINIAKVRSSAKLISLFPVSLNPIYEDTPIRMYADTIATPPSVSIAIPTFLRVFTNFLLFSFTLPRH